MTAVANLRRGKVHKVKIVVAKHAIAAVVSNDIPQLHYDQLRHIQNITTNLPHHSDLVVQVITLTRAQLKKTPEFYQWLQGK